MTDDNYDALLAKLDGICENHPQGQTHWPHRLFCESAAAIRTLRDERDSVVKCPVGMDDTPELCSYTSCRHCLTARAKGLSEELTAALSDIAALLKALAWIDTYDPETIAAAEAKFGFKLTDDHPGAALLRRMEGMEKALEAVVLNYSNGPWDDEKKRRWNELTGGRPNVDETTTEVLCDMARAAIKAGE